MAGRGNPRAAGGSNVGQQQATRVFRFETVARLASVAPCWILIHNFGAWRGHR
jgi:hypothetical protein